jgi:serine protease
VRAIHLPAVDPRDPVERPKLTCLLEVPAELDPHQLARKYRRNQHVAFAEPVIAYEVVATPNDLEFLNQWPHDNAHMDSEAAWDFTSGSPNVPIAFVDTGLDWTHQDLKDNLWINTAEDANSNGQFDNSPYPAGDLNGVDDDGNGKVDDIIGWDFWGNDPDPQHLSGYGTKTAGVAVAATNNVWGVAGIAGGWGSQRGCPVMVLRAGSGTLLSSYYIWQAIDYARINGAKVINMSFVGLLPYQHRTGRAGRLGRRHCYGRRRRLQQHQCTEVPRRL